ncbi:MAG: hypothetical protein WBA43_18985, partial [Elainellaceae cyanobacterium]
MTDWVRMIVKSPIVQKIEQMVPDYSLVGESIFFRNDQFPWANDLEANWSVIRQEFEQVFQ